MKTLLPKSLVGQLLALVAVMLLIAQAVNMVLLYRGAQQETRFEAAASAWSRISGGVERLDRRERLDRPPREGERPRRRARGSRPALSEQSAITADMKRIPIFEQRSLQVFDNLGYDILAVEVAQAQAVPPALINSVIGLGPSRRMARQQGQRISKEQALRKVENFVIMSAQIAPDRWLSVAAVVQDRNKRLIRALIFQTVILYVLLLTPLILLGRYISRPLKTLTSAARNFEPGSSQPVIESGPPDTRQLIAAFNDMNGRVDAMLNEKDVMLGAIGHDLRTPLAALRVRVESVDDPQERERMIVGIDDIDRTLDDILSLARLGRSGEKPEPTDINALIETVVDEFADRGSDVTFERAGRVATTVRSTLIRRALRNLIDNAITYGTRASISVEQGTSQLNIHIDDEGPGIAEDAREALFEPFARAETSRNRQTGGSGLGLTLARAIVREQGGDIILRNRSAGGLRATLTLRQA